MTALTHQPATTGAQRRRTARRRALQPVWNALGSAFDGATDVRALLAVSGGSDSWALLACAARWEGRFLHHLEVACVDHGGRPDAHAEARYVTARARALGFEAHVLTAAETGRRDEQSLRVARYRALAKLADDRGLNVVVTAHTQNDDAEGHLLDLLGAGGGRAGAAMAPGRQLASPGALRLVRPLLGLSRETLKIALSALGGPGPVEDPIDARGAGARARLRHDVLPALVGFRHDAVSRVAEAARRRQKDHAALAAETDAGISVHKDGALFVARGLRPVLRLRLQAACRQLSTKDPRSAHRTLELALDAAESGQTGAVFDLSGVRAEVVVGGLRLTARDA